MHGDCRVSRLRSGAPCVGSDGVRELKCIAVVVIGGTVLASGPGGTEVRVEAGDVVVMPVGVSHAMIDNSEDGMAIGGYPEGRYRDKIQEESVSEADFRAAAKFIMFLPNPGSRPCDKRADSMAGNTVIR
ncbi:hypothetical protein [Mameliella sp. CS4]|uniref:hypothetical protein n=1 Tax=Mameliella sp. CS4 TaxID=2862329 RepID=UPI002108232A|nr:hypothetical protein [Mameliella sp. CS4]